ncbi:MAG: LacI family DNA-binding transcriptional regulator [Phycisphaerae bacterium]
MSSVRSIAKQAGVSITTVSRVLNNDSTVNTKTRQNVLAIANRTGYVPKVGRRVTTYIAFAYTTEQTLAQPFDSAVLAGIARGVDECRFDLVVLDLLRDKRPEETYTQFFMRKGVRGVILRTAADTRESCRSIAEEGFPHVVIAERYDAPKVNYIDSASKPDSVRAVSYLAALGHRRIAFAMHNVPDCDHLDRLGGYKEALAANDIPFDENLVFAYPYTLVGGATVLNMAVSMPNRPTAIYFADPLMGVGAIKRANEVGVRVPDDISIIGFDDTELRYAVHPTMTAVCQDSASLGFEAALGLTRMLTSANGDRFRKTIPTFFEVHQSTAPPPNGSNGKKG